MKAFESLLKSLLKSLLSLFFSSPDLPVGIKRQKARFFFFHLAEEVICLDSSKGKGPKSHLSFVHLFLSLL